MYAQAQSSALEQAALSLRNSAKAVVNFAYGTQNRANITMVCAVLLALAGSMLMSAETQMMLTSCAQ